MTPRFWSIAFLAAMWYTTASSAPQSTPNVLQATTPSGSHSIAANFATPAEAASTMAAVTANSEASSNLIDAWAQTSSGLGVSTPNNTVDTTSGQTTGDLSGELHTISSLVNSDHLSQVSISDTETQVTTTITTASFLSENTVASLSGSSERTLPATEGSDDTTGTPVVRKTSGDEQESATSASLSDATLSTVRQPLLSIITSNGNIATYTPTKDSQFSDLTSTLTTTDGDHNPIVIFPAGWLWSPVGVLPLVAPPAPMLNPGLEGDADHSDENDTQSLLSKADEISATQHESTKTTSYISGSTYTRTGTETCSSPESCPWSEQSTRTTTASEVPFLFMNGKVEHEAYPDTGNVSEKVIEYFEKMFEKAGVALASDKSVVRSTTDTRVTEAPTSTTSQSAQVTSIPSNTYPKGTTIHIEDGCVLVNGSPRCALGAGNNFNAYESTYSVNLDLNKPNSTALILSGFDGSNDNHLHSTASCQLLAVWPSTYGDVTFAKDSCLYDADGNKIFDQCCASPDGDNNGPVINPYVAPAPPDAQQIRGNHDGSALCRSISKATCLAAAARYVDDIVYHNKTSAVWPDGTSEDITNMILPVIGPAIEDLFGINYGCTVIWTCESSESFSRGMTGEDIKRSMLNIYNLDGAKGCGSTYFDNGCHITVNACNNCRDVGRQGTIWNAYSVANGTYGDANNGFPPSS